MGTRDNPGPFDCHAAAEPDEPMFVLLGRDKLAPFLVSLWSAFRANDMEKAGVVFARMVRTLGDEYALTIEMAKVSEAMDCSLAMFAWQKEHQPQ